MNLGTSQQRMNKASSYLKSDTVTLKDGKNIFRILRFVDKIQMVFYPALKVDDQTGEERALTIPFVVGKDSIFEEMAIVDKKLRRDLFPSAKDIRSPLDAVDRWIYLVFDRKEAELKLKVAYFPYTVYNGLKKLQEALYPGKEEYLRHCFLFMHDINIIRSYPESPAKRSAPGGGIEYSTEFLPENPYEGKIPASYLDMGDDEFIGILKGKGSLKKLFSEEELKLIDEPFDTELYTTPISNERFIEESQTLAFNVAAKDSSGNYKFPEQEKYLKQLAKIGYELKAGTPEKALPNPEEKATDGSLKKGEKPPLFDAVDGKKEVKKPDFDIESELKDEDDDLPF